MSAQKAYDFSCWGPTMPFKLHSKGIRITLPMLERPRRRRQEEMLGHETLANENIT